jgi:V/A-type H+-transporting ATPase subunit F
MRKVAIVGDSNSVSGFRPLGLAVFPVEDPADARAIWSQLVGGEYGVVFVTEPVYEAADDLVAETADKPLPAVTIIPSVGSSGGVGQAKISRAIERALGTKMLIGEEGE